MRHVRSVLVSGEVLHIPVVSPLRQGSSSSPRNRSDSAPSTTAYAITEPPKTYFDSIRIDAISTGTTVLRLPPQSKDEDWIRKAATEDLRWLVRTVDGKMSGKPAEVERQLRLDGDSESMWKVKIVPKRSSGGQTNSPTGERP